MVYLLWRFGGGIWGYWRFVGLMVLFISHLMGAKMLFFTLFWPWKRDSSSEKTTGFELQKWFLKHLFNFFARFIGFFVKTFTLLAWLIAELAWIVVAILFFPIWLLSPLSILFLTFWLIKSSLELVNLEGSLSFDSYWLILYLLAYLIILVGLVSLEIKIKKYWKISKLLDPDIKNPRISDPWFQSVCVHLPIDPVVLKEAWINDNLKKILANCRLSRDEFDQIVTFEVNQQIIRNNQKSWWRKENLFSQSPLTENWIFGWTTTLDQFSRPLLFDHNRVINNLHPRESDIIKNLLAEKQGANLILLGENGVGRKKFLQNLALAMARRDVPVDLIGKKIKELHLENLFLSQYAKTSPHLLLERILLETVRAGNVILFIPGLFLYLNDKNTQEGSDTHNIVASLIDFLENAGLKVITSATPEEFHQIMQNKPELSQYFDSIKLEEPNLESCLVPLVEKSQKLEQKFSQLITYEATKKALEVGGRYLQSPAMPKRGLDFLEEAIAFLSHNNPEDHIIKENDIESFASQKLQSNIGNVESQEKEKLMNLEKLMHQKVIGQEEAVKAVVSALKRRRLDLSNPERPAGCFLFLGPTGVGKTHTAETLAQIYFGGEVQMARLDMSEYQEKDAITRLLGDVSGEIEGYFHKILSQNPFSLILLDELEKSSPEVRQILLQIMEEGVAKTGTGAKLNFREAIIIATSNAEALLIQDLLKSQIDYATLQKKVTEQIEKDRIFSPELLNRFDEITIFHPLSRQDMLEVAELALQSLKKRLAEKEIIITYGPVFKQKLAEKGFDPEFGARELRRVVEKQIETAIAEGLLSGTITKGQEFKLPMEYLT